MDSMHEPRKFTRVFTCSYLYVFTMTLPSAATMFTAFPSQSAQYGKPAHSPTLFGTCLVLLPARNGPDALEG